MRLNTLLTFILSAVFSSSACVPRQYHFVNKELSWTEAQRYCRENYKDLATINNKNDIEDLLKSVNDDQIQQVWIGLQKTVNKWKWSLGDPAFYTENNSQYRNWATGQPNNNVDCSNMNPGQWNDYGCDNQLSFICYNDSSKGFIPVQQKMTWRVAQIYCREHHTDLVSVRNQNENQQIEKIRNDAHINDGVWIGLFRDSWEWSDQSNSSFRNWTNVGNNGGGSDKCAVVGVKSDHGKWDDKNCNEKNHFVCHEDKLVLIQKNMSWNEALRYCRENHVDLVSVNSEQIQRQVMELAINASTAEVWLGLRHSCTMGIWFWVNGEILCYQNWAAGNGTGVEDCSDAVRVGAVQSGGDQRWISLPQTHKLNFICTNYDE